MDVVEDIQQETFIRVFVCRRSDTGSRHPERIGAYVISACNNLRQEHYRAQGRNLSTEDTEIDPPDKILNFEKLVIAEEMNEQVREAVKSLAPRERDLI